MRKKEEKNIPQLFERVDELAKEFFGSRTKLAEALHVAQRTFNNYFNKEEQGKMFQYLPKILEICPSISQNWLETGQGEKLLPEEKRRLLPPRTLCNAAGDLVGDLLLDTIKAEIGLPLEDFAKSIGISMEALQELLDSRRAPTWEEMTAMYTVHGISIHFLIAGEGNDIIARDSVTRALSAIKTTPKKLPRRGEISAINLQQLAGASASEAADFIKKYSDYYKKYIAYVIRNGGKLNDMPEAPFLPDKIVLFLSEKYGISTDWLLYGQGQTHTARPDKTERSTLTMQEKQVFSETPAAASSGTVAHTLQKQTEKRQNPTAPAK